MIKKIINFIKGKDNDFEEMCFEESFRILFATDLHNTFTQFRKEWLEERLKETPIDCIITMGDISVNDWKNINHIKELTNSQIAGVLGNHDDFKDLENNNVLPLKNSVTIKGTKIVGFGGSIKYKNANYPLLTDEESVEIANSLPNATIFVTHDRPKIETNDFAHSGLEGISTYINHRCPKYHFYGHTHKRTSEIIKDTKSVGLFRFECWEFNKTGARCLWSLE